MQQPRPLSDEDIDTFYSRKVLGIHSPRALLNTLWMNNCTFFGMRPGKEQRDLCSGNLQLKTDWGGNCFVELTLKDKLKRVPAKTLEILERRRHKGNYSVAPR